MHIKPVLIPIALMFLVAATVHADSAVVKQLKLYQQQGATQGNLQKGESLWNFKSGDRSCSSCHGASLQQPGKHVKTGKPIKPMAPSVNSERYQNSRKIEKWFLRNCKWTFGRECDVQEKSNILAWLSNQ